MGRRLLFILGGAVVGGVMGGFIDRFLTGRPVKAKVTVTIPFMGEVELEPDLTQRQAAWSLYVELSTRIASQPLAPNEGLIREALTSLYNLFGVTREVLKQAGPDVGMDNKSVGGIAIEFLNLRLRPFLAKWHPKLQDWEFQRPDDASPLAHELNWSDKDQCRAELEQLRQDLLQYVEALAQIAKSGRQ